MTLCFYTKCFYFLVLPKPSQSGRREFLGECDIVLWYIQGPSLRKFPLQPVVPVVYLERIQGPFAN